MKILFISHIENDCFLTKTSGIEFETVVDRRSLAEIFADETLDSTNYDIIFIHPLERTDPGWKLAPAPALIFSEGFRKPLLREKVAHIPREIVENHWPFIVDDFSRCGSFIKVLQNLQDQERENL